MNAAERALLEFINGELLAMRTAPAAVGAPARVEPETPLFDDGLIDSLKILRLIAYVESRTGRAIPDEDIVMANFRTARTIAAHFLTEALATVPAGRKGVIASG